MGIAASQGHLAVAPSTPADSHPDAHPDIVVRGRHTEVTERFRAHAVGKLGRVEVSFPK